jgi:thioredoxin reductase
VIVGVGIGGLSAARQLQRKDVSDFVLLELESRPDGNAISGQNEISAFQWGRIMCP